MRKSLWKRCLSAAAGAMISAAVLSMQVCAAGAVTVSGVSIKDGNVEVSAAGNAGSEDGMYHLYAQNVTESAAGGAEVGSAKASAGSLHFSVPLRKNTPESLLYKKFTVMAVQGGKKVPVSNSMFITNPEACAPYSSPRIHVGKKGILPSSDLLRSGQLRQLGIQQATYNIPLANITSGGGVPYVYNGKTYEFNASAIWQYDYVIPLLNAQGIQVTLIFLNNRGGDSSLIHPLSRDSHSANYYAFNTQDEAAVEKLEAIASFFAQRYSGKSFGTVDNWIIGNEINARAQWNYMKASAGIDTYTQEYAKAFRIFYNAIKAQNANARVYSCVDNQFAGTTDSEFYPGQQFLLRLQADLSAEGNIPWDIAVHPYDMPLSDETLWDETGKSGINHTQASEFVTMSNIDVFTDFFLQPSMRSPDGEVKSILCSEQGYTSNGRGGEKAQAASIVLAYQQAQQNQYIDGFILAREQDHGDETKQGLATGLSRADGTHKLAFSWYAAADSPSTVKAAADVIGVQDLSQLITKR